MRTGLLALGTLALSLAATTAFADDGYYRREGHRDECAIERDRARLRHELREGDWREAEQLRHRLWWERADLARDRWQGDYGR